MVYSTNTQRSKMSTVKPHFQLSKTHLAATTELYLRTAKPAPVKPTQWWDLIQILLIVASCLVSSTMFSKS